MLIMNIGFCKHFVLSDATSLRQGLTLSCFPTSMFAQCYPFMCKMHVVVSTTSKIFVSTLLTLF